jgi:hypothetical protein
MKLTALGLAYVFSAMILLMIICEILKRIFKTKETPTPPLE